MARHLKRENLCNFSYKQGKFMVSNEVYHKSMSKRFYIPDAPAPAYFNHCEKVRLALHYEEGFHILKGVFDDNGPNTNYAEAEYVVKLSREKDIAYQTQLWESKNAIPPGDSIWHFELTSSEYLREACGNKCDNVKNEEGGTDFRCFKCMIVFKEFIDFDNHMKESYAKMMVPKLRLLLEQREKAKSPQEREYFDIQSMEMYKLIYKNVGEELIEKYMIC